jgi:hypothetical protein
VDLTLLHPKIVHLPMALAVLMPLISAAVLVAWWRGVLPRAAWLGAIALQGVLVLTGAVSMKTGEQDEERVEDVVPHDAIEAHEEAAEAFVWAGAAVLAIGIGALMLRRERTGQAVALAMVLGTIVVAGLGVNVGAAGGDLVYKYDAPSALGGAPSPVLPAKDARSHGDDSR